jgi:pilus assembly protein CpaF
VTAGTAPGGASLWPPAPEPAPWLDDSGAGSAVVAGPLSPAEFRAAVREIFRRVSAEPGASTGATELRDAAARAVHDWTAERARAGGPIVAAAEQDRLARAVVDEQTGLGPLQPYLDDPEVENIDINGPDQVWLRRRGGIREEAPPVAGTEAELIEMVRRWGLGGQTAREFSEARPIVNIGLGDGSVRIAAVMSVTGRVHVSVRCHRLVDVTLADLAGPGYQTLSPALADFLQAAVAAHLNIIVTGGVNAGKTTLLRALSAAITPEERIATLETDRELLLDQLPCRHQDVVAFEARQANSEGAGAITLSELIPQALRLNPRRIIVGEVRDQEITPMLEAMNSGQQGSLTTIHANSAGEIFSRILMLAQRGRMPMSTEAIHLAVGLCRPLVVHVQQGRDGARYVTEVLEVQPVADGPEPARNRVFTPGPDGRAVPAHSLSPDTERGLLDAGFDPGVLDGSLA